MRNWDISVDDVQDARRRLNKRLYANLARACTSPVRPTSVLFNLPRPFEDKFPQIGVQRNPKVLVRTRHHANAEEANSELREH